MAAAHHGCRGCACLTTCHKALADAAGMTTITGRRAAAVASAAEAAGAAVVSADLAAADAAAVASAEAAVTAEEDSPAVAAAEDKHLKYLEIQKCQ